MDTPFGTLVSQLNSCGVSLARLLLHRLDQRLNRLALLVLPVVLAPPVSAAQASQRPASEVKLVIAATTDVHGRLRGWDYYTGTADAAHDLARASTVVDSIRAANPGAVLLVDAGDMLQGNPLMYVAAKLTRQPVHPTFAAMNAMRYDAAVVGNHEFNYGVPFLDSAVRGAKFPLLGSNVKNANGTAHFAASTIVTRKGVRIGIVGATTVGSNVWDAENLRAAKVSITDMIPAVRAAVKDVRARGADVVVALLHSGLEGDLSFDTTGTIAGAENVSARVAREVRGIDVIVFGHSHRELIDTMINGALLVQPKNWATSVGVATLSLKKAGAKWTVTERHGSKVTVAGHAEAPTVLAVTEAAHKAALAWANTPVGRTATVWKGDSSRVKDAPIVDFMLETMRRETGADLAATASFSLNATIDSGAVTLSELSLLYPYDNTLRAVRISGKQLRAFLEFSSQYFRTINADGSIPRAGTVDLNVCGYNFDIVSGANYTIDLRQPIGQRITELSVKGKPVSDNDSFTLALNNYRQAGGGGYSMIAGAPVTYAKDVDIRQRLIDEVTKQGVLRTSDYFTPNWHIEPASAVGAAYDEMERGQRSDVPCGATTPGAAPKSPATSNAPKATQAEQPASPATAVMAARAPQGKMLRVLSTSDFHAALEAKPERGRLRGGAVGLEAALTQARSECTGECTSITIDGGDLFTGTPASDWDSGKPTLAVYNRLGISAGALGNHEFDFGQDTLRQRLSQLKYRVLAANVVGTDGKVPSWLKADTIVERNGLRIGVIGAAAQSTPSLTKRRNLKGLQFLAPAPIVSERIKAMRAARVDAVIVTIHDGVRCTNGTSEGCAGSGMEFIKALTEKPDVVIMAHSHTNVILNSVNGIPTVQVTSNGRGIGVIDIPLPSRTDIALSIRDVTADSLKAFDAVTDTIVKNAVSRVKSRLEAPVGTVSELYARPGEQYPLGNLIADAARVMGNADFGAWNNGGIRADLRAGPLNYGGVHELSPFGNVLAKLSIKGKDITRLMEGIVAGKAPNTHVSGLMVVYDSTKASGSRIVSITMTNGKSLDAEHVYTICVNDFMIDDPGFMERGNFISTDVLPIVDNDALAAYFKRLPQPIVAPPELRIRAVGPNGELR